VNGEGGEQPARGRGRGEDREKVREVIWNHLGENGRLLPCLLIDAKGKGLKMERVCSVGRRYWKRCKMHY